MKVTEVKIKLTTEFGGRLLAFCSITIDGEFVVRDLRIIEGEKGPFVAMPSRRLHAKCPGCGHKNELLARYCNQCGVKFSNADSDTENDTRLFVDIAHPINGRCRKKIEAAVLKALDQERMLAQQPDYVCTYDEL